MKVFLSRARTDTAKQYIDENKENIIHELKRILNANNISLVETPEVDDYLNYALNTELAVFSIDIFKDVFADGLEVVDIGMRERLINEINYFINHNIPTLFL